MNEIKEKIIELLKSTGRSGIQNLIDYMEINGFFTAPCSGSYHLAEVGGLAKHSLNVYSNINIAAQALYSALDYSEMYESLVLTSILHDLGKIGQYGKPNYVENILKSGKRSDSKPYATNPDLIYVPHEIRSIHIASQFIQLTEEESFAILQHNGMYGDLKYSLKDSETPLQMLLHFSDMWASRVDEVDKNEHQ